MSCKLPIDSRSYRFCIGCKDKYMCDDSTVKIPMPKVKEPKRDDIDFSKTGQKVKGKSTGELGVVLRIFKNGSVQVLQRISPYVICTYDNYEQLEEIEWYEKK